MNRTVRILVPAVALLFSVAMLPHASAEERKETKEEAIRVIRFSIIDTQTQEPVKGFEKIARNDTISIGKLPTEKINVRANVSGKPGSVRFLVPEAKVNRVASKAPYSLAGDIDGRFLKRKVKPGTYTLAAIPYTSGGGRSDRGQHLKVKITFTE